VQAKERNMYVIFDFHVWQGQERGRTATSGSAGETARAAAYDLITFGVGDKKERQRQQKHAVDTWRKVLEHYRGEPAIAAMGAYQLLA
jgi:hypothetical protein